MPEHLTERSPLTAAPEARRRWTTCRAVLFVFVLACIVRVVAMGSLPLLVTEDGVDYLRLGESVAAWFSRAGDWPDIPVVRTPGYPVLLGLIIWFFGKGPIAILMVQHLMGVGIATSISWSTAKLAGTKVGPWLGTIVGTLVAVDPWLIACESFLLTEAASAFFITIPAACVLAWRRPTIWSGLFVGACVACAIHIRPACQVLLPFFVGAAMLAGFDGWRRLARWREAVVPAVLCGSGATVALAAILGPWLIHNSHRNVRGMAQGFDTQLWIYFWKEGVVDDADMPPEFRDAFLKAGLDKILPQEKRAYEFLPFISDLNAWGDVGVGKKLGIWAKASAARNSGKYAHRFKMALLTQLNYHTDASNILWEELPGFVYALGRGWGPDSTPERQAITKNFMVYEERDILKNYRMPTDGGLPGKAIRWYAEHHPKGVPYVGLFALAIVVCFIALVRGRWGVGLVLSSIIGSMLVYAMLLAIFARYGVPYWMPLYLTPGALVACLRRDENMDVPVARKAVPNLAP